MNKLLILILGIVFSYAVIANEKPAVIKEFEVKVGILTSAKILRIYDEELNIVCYSRSTNVGTTMYCLELKDKLQKEKKL